MNDYALLDFGDGRRLERFGSKIVDRLCPIVEGVRKENPAIWGMTDFRFVPDEKYKNSERGRSTPNLPEPWPITVEPIRFELRGTPFGHVGLFPEQRENWRRIIEHLGRASEKRTETLRILNLFAYTGGSSIAAALAETPSADTPIEVVHVDSAKTVVDWARRNAELNGISNGIRYVVEDVRKFVGREIKRGNRYDAVILDPPSYGHGVKGESWKIFDHLPELLVNLVSLLNDDPVLFLLTAHTPGLDALRLGKMLFEAGFPENFHTEYFSMGLEATTGKRLPLGGGIIYSR